MTELIAERKKDTLSRKQRIDGMEVDDGENYNLKFGSQVVDCKKILMPTSLLPFERITDGSTLEDALKITPEVFIQIGCIHSSLRKGNYNDKDQSDHRTRN